MVLRKIPSLNWLRTFEAAAQTESFSAAARLLNMSPSAVSQQINALETYLGTALFLRGAKSVHLTEAGYLFLPAVRQAMISVEASASAIRDARSQDRLLIHANSVFAHGWLAPRLADFQAKHPWIGLSVECSDHFDQLQREGADIKITFGPPLADWGTASKLFSEVVFPVASPALAAGIKTPKDLLQHNLIEVAPHRQNWSRLLAALDVPGAEQAAVTQASNTALALSMAAAGFGLALARAPATDWLVRTLGLVRCPVAGELKGEEFYHLVVCSRGRPSEKAEAFRDWVLAELAT